MTDWVALIRAKVEGEGTVTYRCHTCGEPITDDAYLDEESMTTHHASHLEETD